MPRTRDPVPRARAAGHWLGGILLLGLLGGGVVAAAVLLWENLDVRQLAPRIVQDPGPLPDPEPAVPPAVEPGTFRAVILNTPRNREFYPDAEYYPKAIERWRGLVREVGGEVRYAGSLQDLAGLGASELLLVPEAPCLSQEEVSAVLRHLRAGGGVVANWAVGARDEDCEWRGWGTVADLTGAGDVRELAHREALYLTVPGGMALSPGLDPGSRIELRPEPSLALHLPGPRVYWSDWALNPAPDESGGGADVAAAAVRDESGGRVAWFGFRLSQAATARDSTRLERLVQNGVLWAAGRAVAAVSSWPDGKRSALLLVEDVEAEHQNAEAMARLLKDLGLPGTFFAVSQLVVEDAELGRALVEAGEVGSQTSDHNPVAGLPYQDQAVRLRRSWTEIRDWTGIPPAGLRPPEEAFDSNTLRAWEEAGGGYVLAVNQARSGSPEIHRLGNRAPIVLLPRLMKDDYNVFVQEGALRTERLSVAFLEGMEKLRAIGGLAVVALHTQIVGTGRHLDAVRAVADAASREGDWWIGTAGTAADWWRKRAEIRITAQTVFVDDSSSTASAPEGLSSQDPSVANTLGVDALPAPGPDLIVHAPDAQNIEGVCIDIVLPMGTAGVIPTVDGVPVAHTRTEWGLRVPLGSLEAGEVRALSLIRMTPDSSPTRRP